MVSLSQFQLNETFSLYTNLFLSFRSQIINPDASTVAVDDVGNLEDFNEFPAFPQVGNGAHDFSDFSNDSGFISNSQDLICPCCLQELDDIGFP